MSLDELEKKYPGSPCHDWAPSVSGAYYFCVLQKGHTGPHYAEWRTWGTGDPCDELREVIAAD